MLRRFIDWRDQRRLRKRIREWIDRRDNPPAFTTVTNTFVPQDEIDVLKMRFRVWFGKEWDA